MNKYKYKKMHMNNLSSRHLYMNNKNINECVKIKNLFKINTQIFIERR